MQGKDDAENDRLVKKGGRFAELLKRRRQLREVREVIAGAKRELFKTYNVQQAEA